MNHSPSPVFFSTFPVMQVQQLSQPLLGLIVAEAAFQEHRQHPHQSIIPDAMAGIVHPQETGQDLILPDGGGQQAPDSLGTQDPPFIRLTFPQILHIGDHHGLTLSKQIQPPPEQVYRELLQILLLGCHARPVPFIGIAPDASLASSGSKIYARSA